MLKKYNGHHHAIDIDFKKVNYDLKSNISLCECTSFLDANGDTVRDKLQRFDNWNKDFTFHWHKG